MNRTSSSARRKKSRGFTVLELVISGTIMVAVIMISFDVMLTGVKISRASMDASTSRNQARAGIDDIKLTLDQGKGMMASVTSGPKTLFADDSRYFFVRKPAIGPGGHVLDDKDEVVMYLLMPALKPEHGPNVLVRQTVYVNGITPVSTEERKTLMTNVDSMRVRYFASRTISPTLSTYLLPGDVVNTKPVGSQVRIFEMIAPWHSLRVRSNRTSEESEGLNVLSIGADIKVVGNVVSIDVPSILAKPVDFVLEVDGRNVADAATMTNFADSVSVSITQIVRDKDGKSRKEIREINARLKNR